MMGLIATNYHIIRINNFNAIMGIAISCAPMPCYPAPARENCMPEKPFAEEAELQRLIAAHRDRPGALLPILHAVQEAFGYVDDAAVPIIAKALNLSRAEVHGVLTFYHDFRREPAGRHVLRLCRAEACQSMGCEKLAEGCGHASASISAARRPTAGSLWRRSTAWAIAPCRPRGCSTAGSMAVSMSADSNGLLAATERRDDGPRLCTGRFRRAFRGRR